MSTALRPLAGRSLGFAAEGAPLRSGAGGRPLRILFVGEATTYAHVARPAVLARWARAAGHEAFLACGEAYAHVARMEGFEPLAVPTVPRSVIDARVALARFFYTEAELAEYARAEMALCERLDPDLLVGDHRLSLDVAARVAGRPLVALLNAHWSPHGPCRLPAPNGGFLRRLPHPLRSAAMAAVRPFAFRFFASPVLNRLRRRYGLPGWSDFRRHFAAGTWCAYLDLPRFHPLAQLPDSHFFLGPIPWKPSGLPDFPLRGLGARRPLAYVTLGGSGDGSSLRQVLEALSGLDCDIALSGIEERAAYRLAGEFPGLEGRFQAACLANPDPVLERASFTVCHGGSGTVYQSLAAGVPLLCLPSNPDQGMVAADCARAGAGLTVEVWRATKKRAARAAQALLEKERYREQARRLGADLGAFDTRKRWLDFLDRARAGLPLAQRAFRA